MRLASCEISKKSMAPHFLYLYLYSYLLYLYGVILNVRRVF